MNQAIVKNYIETYFGNIKSNDIKDFYSHGAYCEKISKKLFMNLISLNLINNDNLFLYKKYENVLYLASVIHDIGNFIPSDKPHNKSGAKFILKNNVKDLSEEENLILANVVRFHKGKSPKDKNKLFSMLNDDLKQIVKLYAGILRIADALDFEHCEIIDDISLKDDAKSKTLKINLDCDLSNNVGFNLVFKKKRKLLGKLLDRKICLEVA